MSHPEPLVRLRNVSKSYRSLRPLRVEQLDLAPGQRLALMGFDRAMAEVLVDLVTGATVPDEGEVEVFGQLTTAIPDSDTWLKTLDHFGLVSERVVLVEQLTAEENLAIAFTLDLEGMPDALRARVRELAAEVDIGAADLNRHVAVLPAEVRLRIRLGRALALNPRVVLAEHPNAALSPDDTSRFAADFVRVVQSRSAAAIVLTADSGFAAAIGKVLTLQPATGALKPSASWRRWFT